MCVASLSCWCEIRPQELQDKEEDESRFRHSSFFKVCACVHGYLCGFFYTFVCAGPKACREGKELAATLMWSDMVEACKGRFGPLWLPVQTSKIHSPLPPPHSLPCYALRPLSLSLSLAFPRSISLSSTTISPSVCLHILPLNKFYPSVAAFLL